MPAAGLGKVEAAKQDGTWYALDSVEALVIPPDLVNALAANETAKQYFDAYHRSVKRVILAWIVSAKRQKHVPGALQKRSSRQPGIFGPNQWQQ
jgi:uncharacterized protein YdeI (YjbR/CyaY-like superfamily)